MPTGGKLTFESSCVELDADHVRGHFGAKPGHYGGAGDHHGRTCYALLEMTSRDDRRFLPALPPNVERAVRSVRERLGRRLGQELLDVRLFGSYVRGEQHEESDVDVLILLASEPADEDPIFDEIAEIDRLEHVWISPLICSRPRYEEMIRDEVGIALEIEAEGIRL